MSGYGGHVSRFLCWLMYLEYLDTGFETMSFGWSQCGDTRKPHWGSEPDRRTRIEYERCGVGGVLSLRGIGLSAA